MKRIIIALFACLLPSLAAAQSSPVYSSGSPVVPGQVPYWISNGIIGPGVTANDSPVTTFGVTSNTTSGFCISSQRAAVGNRQQLCFGAPDSSPATISLQNYGTDSTQSLNFVINGITYPFPGTLSQIIVGTTPVNGGSNGACLYVAGTVVGQTTCTLTAITSLTGDVAATGPGTTVATLATVNTNIGTFGSSATVPIVTINGKGLITAANNATIAIPGTQLLGPTLAPNIISSSLQAVGTISSGIWQSTIISPIYGGTGVNNGSNTLTLGASLTTTGTGTPNLAFPNTLGFYTYTFQAFSDTIVMLATTDTLTNKTLTSPTINGGALSGTFTGTPTLSGANFVTNANLVKGAAASLKGNPTASLANVQDFTIQGGVDISSPSTTLDWIPIYNHSTGTIEKVNAAELTSSVGSGVTSLNGLSGTPAITPIVSATGATITIATIPPQGRLTLLTGTPVLKANTTAISEIFYDCYRGGRYVPNYNGTIDIMLPIGSCEITDTMPTSSTGVTNAAGVFDIWAINVAGTLTLCHATNGSGGGWASDAAGSNTARGTGYSQLDYSTRPYITNANSITHCYNGGTDKGSISANQATYLGTLYTTAAGQTGMSFSASASGGGAPCLCLFNAYNRIFMTSQEIDTATNWTYNSLTWRHTDNNVNNSIYYVDGLAEVFISGSISELAENAAQNVGIAIGIAQNWSSGAPAVIAMQYAVMTGGLDVYTSPTASGSFLPSMGYNAINGVEATQNTNSTGFGATAVTGTSAVINIQVTM